MFNKMMLKSLILGLVIVEHALAISPDDMKKNPKSPGYEVLYDVKTFQIRKYEPSTWITAKGQDVEGAAVKNWKAVENYIDNNNYPFNIPVVNCKLTEDSTAKISTRLYIDSSVTNVATPTGENMMLKQEGDQVIYARSLTLASSDDRNEPLQQFAAELTAIGVRFKKQCIAEYDLPTNPQEKVELWVVV